MFTENYVHDPMKLGDEKFKKAAIGKTDNLVPQLLAIFKTIELKFEAQVQTEENQEVIRDKRKIDFLILQA